MKKLTKSKLGLNKDNLRQIANDQLSEVIGGVVHSTSATCSQSCITYTIMLDGTGTCK